MKDHFPPQYKFIVVVDGLCTFDTEMWIDAMHIASYIGDGMTKHVVGTYILCIQILVLKDMQ